jgi:hypothetical protein
LIDVRSVRVIYKTVRSTIAAVKTIIATLPRWA